jgi:hypothetical protein
MKKKPKSYAQLFFDPETKNLVALMEVNLPTRSTMYPHDGQQKEDPCGTLQPRNPKKYSSNDDAFYGKTSMTNNRIVEESRFQDQTLLTKCSSVSSETKCDGPDQFCPITTEKLRFSDEPIVFSNETDFCFPEDGDLGLYLLQDCNCDPFWDTNIRKGCTETLKKLLTLRPCVSLASL